MSDLVDVVVYGSSGRMGQAVIACSQSMPETEVLAKIDVDDDFTAAIPTCDVVIDFSHHSAIEPVLVTRT